MPINLLRSSLRPFWYRDPSSTAQSFEYLMAQHRRHAPRLCSRCYTMRGTSPLQIPTLPSTYLTINPHSSQKHRSPQPIYQLSPLFSHPQHIAKCRHRSNQCPTHHPLSPPNPPKTPPFSPSPSQTPQPTNPPSASSICKT